MSRRMISPKLVDTDLFLSMPVSARLLYYDLNIRADDDGFVGSPKRIMQLVKASDDDLRVLITRGFVITFETGICVIRHWKIHNYIRPDRYHPTMYQNEIKQLILTNQTYEKKDDIPVVGQLSYQMDTEVRLDNSNNIYNSTTNKQESIFEILEVEFGRPLSPMEIEVAKQWTFPIEILKLAIKEAVTSNNCAMKYIDKILYNWEKLGVKSVKDAEYQMKLFREAKKKKKNNLPERQADTTGANYYQKL